MLSLLLSAALAAPCVLPMTGATGLVTSGAPGVGLTLELTGPAPCVVVSPTDTVEAGAVLDALAGLPGAASTLPAGLVAVLPSRLSSLAGEPVGVARSRGVTVGDVAVVVAGAWTTREACPYPWLFAAFRRVDDDWTLVHGRFVTGTMPISCVFPDVTSACEVPWDGGLVCDIHINPTCPDGARVVPLGCVPRCVDVRTCAPVPALPMRPLR